MVIKIKKMSRIFATLVVFILFTTFNALAEEEVLCVSLEDAVSMALKASEDVQMKENEIARSRSQVREERSDILPHILSSASWSRNYDYPDVSATALMKEYDLNIGATFDQTLFTFGRISSAIASARSKVEVSQWNKRAKEREVIYLTKLAYYNVYLAQRTLEITQSSYERAQANKNILQTRSAQGRVSRYDNIKIASDIASRVPSINSARANLNSALQTFKRIVGVDFNRNIEITDKPADIYQLLDTQQLVAELNNNQPILKSLEKSVAANELTVREKKAEYFPEISAFSTWNHAGSGNEYDVGEKNLYDYGVVGLKVSFSLWEGGERREELEQARIDKRNAELSLAKMNKDLLLELNTAVGEYNEFIKALSAIEESVRLAEDSFALSQDFFRSGQISTADLNDAELLLTNAKLKREKMLFDINATLAKIEKLTVTDGLR